MSAPRGRGPRRIAGGATAAAIGASRVTARRYLEYLADNGLAQRELHYGQVDRPEVFYRLTRW